jgi:hypothetical protein
VERSLGDDTNPDHVAVASRTCRQNVLNRRSIPGKEFSVGLSLAFITRTVDRQTETNPEARGMLHHMAS